jgi:hypothetical protein
MLLASLLSIVIPAGCRRPVSGRASDALERARSFVLAHEDTSRLYLDSVRVLDDGSEWRVLFLLRGEVQLPAERPFLVDKATGQVRSVLYR